MSAPVAAVVPSLGLSPVAEPALAALRRELAAAGGVLVWVHQGSAAPAPVLDRPGERLLALAEVAGFARAANAGIAAAGGTERIALVNDDCLLEPGWLDRLARALDAHPGAAAAQGVNLQLDRPGLADGWGLGFNRWLEAVQLGHGEPALPAGGSTLEVFGVSATAALYRRAALDAVALAAGQVFDERLGSYYEDAELALRLRAAGFEALAVPAARARHAGSATGGRRPVARWAAIRGNRWAIAAGWLGARFPLALHRLAGRDLIDLARALARARGAEAAGVVAGWGRALRLVPRFARRGPPRPPLAAATRLRVISRG